MRASLFAATTLLVVSATAVAAADVIPPEQAACQGMDAGDNCSGAGGSSAGTCQGTTCSKLTYYPDGGHGSTTYPCLECFAVDAGAAQDAGADAAGSGSAGGGGGSSGCSFGRAGSLAGTFALALVVPALLRRRRRA
jgi:hypothetical protein